jgi:hypothetical protein
MFMSYSTCMGVVYSMLLTGFAASVVEAGPVPIRAQPVIQREVTPRANPAYRATRQGVHVVYGTVVAVHGSQLTVKLRNNRSINVDASPAIANGDYSAPLFVGKLVNVDGAFKPNGVLSAAHVFRLVRLEGLRPDR